MLKRQQEDVTIRECIKYQHHKHLRFNCWQQQKESDMETSSGSENESCKYFFPWPILDDTHILQPLILTTNNNNDNKNDRAAQRQTYKRALKNWYTIYAVLRVLENRLVECLKQNRNQFPVPIRQDEFLREVLQMTYQEYILALRAPLKRSTVFLKRNSNEITINPYNRQIMLRHRANMDIQFVLDSYGVAAYLTSYMMKSQAKMSRLLRQASLDVERGNLSIREKLYAIASKFQNCSEISAQECVYHLLSMPVSRCTRKMTFILSFPIGERYAMIYKEEILKKTGSIVNRYLSDWTYGSLRVETRSYERCVFGRVCFILQFHFKRSISTYSG